MGGDMEAIGRRDALRRVAGAGAVGAAAWAAPTVTGVSVVPRFAQASTAGGSTVIVPDPGPGETLGADYNAALAPGTFQVYSTVPQTLYAYVWEPIGPPEIVIIYCIGQGFLAPSPITDVPEQIKRQVNRGAVLASLSYRGFPPVADSWPAGVTDVKNAYGWAAATYPGVPIVYWGHSAGAHYSAHAGVEFGVPWVGMSSFYWWAGFGSEGLPWVFWATLVRDWLFEPTPPSTPPPEADVPFTSGSPPAYLIGGDMDGTVHPSETLDTVDLLTSLGVPVHHDNVDTGPNLGRSHEPFTGFNVPALDSWIDSFK